MNTDFEWLPDTLRNAIHEYVRQRDFGDERSIQIAKEQLSREIDAYAVIRGRELIEREEHRLIPVRGHELVTD